MHRFKYTVVAGEKVEDTHCQQEKLHCSALFWACLVFPITRLAVSDTSLVAASEEEQTSAAR